MIEKMLVYLLVALMKIGLVFILGISCDIPINYNIYIAIVATMIMNNDVMKDYDKI